MKLEIVGDVADLMNGLMALAPEIGVEIGSGGFPVSVLKSDENQIEVIKSEHNASIRYAEKIHFFRALGLFVEALQTGDREFRITEIPQFSMNGPMIDVSQGNAVLKVDTVKALLRKLSLMGLNMVMLYAEDSFDVKEQPYFGYMRGRYSQADIREIDEYAYMLGIELIPCIQTLSHFRDVLKWSAFDDLRDDWETLLVGYERTYEFIEQLIVAASAPVRTKRIHIGMDEAWHLGLGRYLRKNGYRSTFDIMTEHLRRVIEITDRHGLKPMMWSDMFFRAASVSGDDYYDLESDIPQAIINQIPKHVKQIAWIYHERNEDFYIRWFQKHIEFGSMPIFAGGIWNWHVFALNYGITFASTNAAMSACKKVGVKEIIATLWGDDGTECDLHAAMLGLQLYAEHGYAETVDEDKLARRFKFCTGGNYQDFMDIRYIDETPGVPEGNYDLYNPSRYLMWQNVLLGLFDYNIRGLKLNDHYKELTSKMAEYKSRNGAYNPVFEFYEQVCFVLSMKSEIGLRITDAYLGGRLEEFRSIVQSELPEIARRVRALRLFHRSRWHDLYKPFGWEVIDVRYGTLLASLDSAIVRIQDYLDGRIQQIEELEEPRLPFQGQEGIVLCYYYPFIPSASRVAWYEN